MRTGAASSPSQRHLRELAPFGAFAAAVLFGASTALSFRLATSSDSAAVIFRHCLVLTLIAVAA